MFKKKKEKKNSHLVVISYSDPFLAARSPAMRIPFYPGNIIRRNPPQLLVE